MVEALYIHFLHLTYSGCSKLLLVESGFPDLFFVTISLGFARFFYEHARPSLLMFLGRPDSFLLHKQPSSLNSLYLVYICIGVGDCFESSLTIASCTVLFDCDRAYSNTQNAFSLPVKRISINVKKKTLSIKFRPVKKHAIRIKRNVNGKSIRYQLVK